MILLCLVWLAIAAIAGFISLSICDEITVFLRLFSVISLLLSLFFMPWQLQFIVLLFLFRAHSSNLV